MSAEAFAQLAALAALAGDGDRAREPGRLHRSYAQVYSQGGEDGYLAEIFRRIGEGSRTFLEIGVGNGTENTTRFLLEQGWRGYWIEGDAAHAAAAAETFAAFIASGNLTILPLMVTRENINVALAKSGAPAAFDLVSIDIDINTSHIWRVLSYAARVCCIEYNASLPASAALEVPYDAERGWDGTNHFGAGLKTLERIGAARAMALVGCDLPGINAYFVSEAEDLAAFCAPFTAENHHEPPRYSLISRTGHPPSPTARAWDTAEP